MGKDGYHLSLTLGRELWDELLGAALPVKVADGQYDLLHNGRQAIRQLGVRQRIRGLLEDRETPELVQRARNRARSEWHKRKGGIKKAVKQAVRVEGDWKVELDQQGTRFRYGQQRVGADAVLKGTISGTLHLAQDGVELPFTLERRLGASISLGDIHYDKSRQQVIGQLGHVEVDAGEGPVRELLARLAEHLLLQRLPDMNPLPILKKDQVEDIVGGVGGSLRVKMGVEDLKLVVDEEAMTLHVRFGFSQLQLEDQQQS